MEAPKQKAEELVNSFRMILMDEDTDCGNEILCTIIAKRCALLCVKETLKDIEYEYETYVSSMREMSCDIFIDASNKNRVYWNEVKIQIDNI